MNAIRVLIIDDDEDDFLLTSDLLTQVAGRPVQAAWADAYASGIEWIRRGEHDIYPMCDFS